LRAAVILNLPAYMLACLPVRLRSLSCSPALHCTWRKSVDLLPHVVHAACLLLNFVWRERGEWPAVDQSFCPDAVPSQDPAEDNLDFA
jgi:hypothetical protein